ncbi:MAG TPA: penicillin-binding transpeptidase domain-containing protein [Microbacteriaceae bacterium]|nr:penicillin-binding transpeptidase domain-containing protein [Microbacteriaceae bacterium]
MNRELKRLSSLVLGMFLALLVSSTLIQLIHAPQLEADARNTRTRFDSYNVQRGPILVAGTPIAESVAVKDDYRWQRVYPAGDLYSAVTGYFPILGQATGLEGALDAYLGGTSSDQFLEKLQSLVTGQPPKGASVETTIDPIAQQAAWDALGDLQGAVIVTEPATGRIVAMVSKPGFDPNALASHDQSAVEAIYQRLVIEPTQPLSNRAIAGNTNPPGSVFKLVVVAAALESGRFNPDSEFPNPSSLILPGTSTEIRNTEGGTCGGGATVTIATALRLSCNIPFAELGLQLGAKAIREQAEKFGFNSSVAVPMESAVSVYPRVLDDAQTMMSAFGQFDVRATPLQIAMVSAAIANGGLLMKPTVVDSVARADLSQIASFSPTELRRAISSQTAATMTAMMTNGVNSGAASNARIPGVAVAGKTGTAQNGPSDPYTLWFTGFAPADAPRFAVTVLIENGGGLGQTGYGNLIAAPIAKNVLEAVLNK